MHSGHIADAELTFVVRQACNSLSVIHGVAVDSGYESFPSSSDPDPLDTNGVTGSCNHKGCNHTA